MGLIEQIKEFWRNRNTKKLPEGQRVMVEKQESNSFFMNLIRGNKKKQNSQLDYDIERFLNAYYYNLQKYNGRISNYRVAYTSLVGLNARQVTRR